MPKPKDITGQRFGRLVAIRLMDERRNGKTVWECKCDCGNVALVQTKHLQNGSTKSCGCRYKEIGEERRKDITGQRFGRLTANRLASNHKDGRSVWECKCDCGNVALVQAKSLKDGNTRSCGCLMKEVGEKNIKDIAGQRFGRLVALKLTDKRKAGYAVWECKCDCGNEVLVRGSDLVSGGTKSCGCLVHDKMVERGKNYNRIKRFGLIENTSVSIIKSQKLRSDSTTGYRGVSYYKRKGKYSAEIGFKKKNYRLGYFDTLEEAVEVRKQAEKMLFEPFIKWYEENYLKGVGSPHGEGNS